MPMMMKPTMAVILRAEVQYSISPYLHKAKTSMSASAFVGEKLVSTDQRTPARLMTIIVIQSGVM